MRWADSSFSPVWASGHWHVGPSPAGVAETSPSRDRVGPVPSLSNPRPCRFRHTGERGRAGLRGLTWSQLAPHEQKARTERRRVRISAEFVYESNHLIPAHYN